MVVVVLGLVVGVVGVIVVASLLVSVVLVMVVGCAGIIVLVSVMFDDVVLVGGVMVLIYDNIGGVIYFVLSDKVMLFLVCGL